MSMYPIASYTVSGGSTSSFSFTSIPQTFTHLQLRSWCATTSGTGGNTANFQFNNDAGSNYNAHYILSTGSSVLSGSEGNSTSTWGFNYAFGGFGSFAIAITDILDYTNTNKNKVHKSIAGYDANTNGVQGAWMFSGLWMSTAAINSITVISSNSNPFVAGSRFDLYGISTSNATGA